MGIILNRFFSKKGKVGIWKIEEDEKFFQKELKLTHDDYQKLTKFHKRRRIEWLAGRFLINKLSNKKRSCVTDEYGKPFLDGSAHQISISHSDGYAAAILHNKTVGIDIQKITPKIERIASKFLRKVEAKTLKEETALEQLHVYWGAKEALYKAYGKRQLDFKKHILVQPFEYSPTGGTISGVVAKEEFFAEYKLHYEKIDNHIMVCAEETYQYPTECTEEEIFLIPAHQTA